MVEEKPNQSCYVSALSLIVSPSQRAVVQISEPRLLILLSTITFPFFFASTGAVENAAAAFCGLWCLVLRIVFCSR